LSTCIDGKQAIRIELKWFDLGAELETFKIVCFKDVISVRSKDEQDYSSWSLSGSTDAIYGWIDKNIPVE